MKLNLLIGIILSIVTIITGCTTIEPPAPHGPVPSEDQMRWQEMEY